MWNCWANAPAAWTAQDNCCSGDEVEPGSSLAIGSDWHDYYCVQVLPPSKEVAGWGVEADILICGIFRNLISGFGWASGYFMPFKSA